MQSTGTGTQYRGTNTYVCMQYESVVCSTQRQVGITQIQILYSGTGNMQYTITSMKYTVTSMQYSDKYTIFSNRHTAQRCRYAVCRYLYAVHIYRYVFTVVLGYSSAVHKHRYVAHIFSYVCSNAVHRDNYMYSAQIQFAVHR
jgi:hypothetical protein